MITIEIYHVAFEEKRRLVAILTSHRSSIEAALDDAYAGTQNIESSWVRSQGQNGVKVTPIQDTDLERGSRSTSVGDYARVTDGTQESFWRCSSFGWKPILNRADIELVALKAIEAAYGN
jgi:hypothetical protein